MQSKSLTSCFSTLILLIIKDIRHERRIHQGALAQSTGKTPNAWTKIENGQSPLTIDALFGACTALFIQPSDVMRFAERLIPIFNSAGWFFQTVNIEKEEDQLLPLVLNYYNSKGYDHLCSLSLGQFSKVTIMDFCFFSFRNFVSFPTVVRYCCETEFREWIDNGAKDPILIPSNSVLTTNSKISEYNWDVPLIEPSSSD